MYENKYKIESVLLDSIRFLLSCSDCIFIETFRMEIDFVLWSRSCDSVLRSLSYIVSDRFITYRTNCVYYHLKPSVSIYRLK